jgi:hypothetical protein
VVLLAQRGIRVVCADTPLQLMIEVLFSPTLKQLLETTLSEIWIYRETRLDREKMKKHIRH